MVFVRGEETLDPPEADPLTFTLRFPSDDGAAPCDIPFCLTEFSPGACPVSEDPL